VISKLFTLLPTNIRINCECNIPLGANGSGDCRLQKKKADEKDTARQLQHIIKVICSAPMHLLPRISISIKYKRLPRTHTQIHTHTVACFASNFESAAHIVSLYFFFFFCLTHFHHSFLSKLSMLPREVPKEGEKERGIRAGKETDRELPLRFWDTSSYAIFALYF